MEPAAAIARHEAIDHDDRLAHRWRMARLTGLGVPRPPAQVAAGHIGRHQVATLARRGCPPRLALRILG
jgi:hypothetical protein